MSGIRKEARRGGSPSGLVSIPMLGGKGAGAFVSVRNRLSTSLASDTSSFKVL
jgi:hypothetical protein